MYTTPECSMVNKNDKFVTFCTKAGLQRLLPTLAVYISQLENYIQLKQQYPDLDIDFAFDRLGTHPLENLNGDIRIVANNNDNCFTTSHIVARAHMVKTLLLKYGISIPHKGRVNTGGLRMSACLNILEAPELKIDALVDSIFAACGAISPETILTKDIQQQYINEFFKFLQDAEKQSDEKNTYLKLNIPHETRNSAIASRNIGYNSN